MKKRTFEVVEAISIYEYKRTPFDTLDEAVRLMALIQEKGGKSYVYSYTDGTPKLEAGDDSITIAHEDKGDFADHSGLVGHSTMERDYNKNGRLA